MWISFARAELAIAEDEVEKAQLALQRAMELSTKYRMRWYRAYAILNLAALLRSGEQKEKLRELLEEAMTEFDAMGAEAYVEEIQAELKSLKES